MKQASLHRDKLRDPPVRSAMLRLAPRPAAARLGRRSVRDVLDWAPSDAIERTELLVSE
jgi:hypothetical protein